MAFEIFLDIARPRLCALACARTGARACISVCAGSHQK
jgi:hypothetical protein